MAALPKILRSFLSAAVFACGLLACSGRTLRNNDSSPFLPASIIQNKRVALLAVEGDASARRIVEVALINQLALSGDFFLVPKTELEALRQAPDQNAADLQGLIQKSRADYGLKITIEKFEAPVREGYSSQVIKDSQLAAEMGTDGSTEQVYRVKAMEGSVRLKLSFLLPTSTETIEGIATAQKTVEASAQKEAIHLPPPLRFLEELTRQALADYFARAFRS